MKTSSTNKAMTIAPTIKMIFLDDDDPQDRIKRLAKAKEAVRERARAKERALPIVWGKP